MNLLILCTGNSARSIIAEALFNARSGGRVKAFSAGSKPQGTPHRLALETLSKHGVSAEGARSKRWDEFAGPDAPQMDAVITVCDSAAAETCPVWPGAPVQVHWGLPDPAAAPEAGAPGAFEAVFHALDARVRAFLDSGAGPENPGALAAALRRAHQQEAAQ